ncbi:single-stranded DNA-binding protein [Sinorhizobium fredii]|uniref:single-stranded DNA-binding protein n=1 Tax=Rhizobium fredii TaxID=380 RepID=UPI0035125577
MMHGCIYGRLGGDPVERRTRDDNVWATGSLAVNIDQEQDAPPLWIGIVAFGRLADDLLRHRKGDRAFNLRQSAT